MEERNRTVKAELIFKNSMKIGCLLEGGCGYGCVNGCEVSENVCVNKRQT